MVIKKILIVLLFISLPVLSQEPVYIGTYTKTEGHVDGKAEGIYLMYRNVENGKLSRPETVAEVINPSFVKTSQDGKNLYAVSELGDKDDNSGYIHSFKRNKDNSLEELGKLSTESFAPCHIETDKSGKYVFVANYMGGVVMVYKRDKNGNLKTNQKIVLENPDVSHAHSVNMSADNKTAYIADLGNDKIWIFDFDEEKGYLTKSLQPYVSLAKGSGPRHFTLSEEGNYAYSINELKSSISVFKVDKNGGLEFVERKTTLPENFEGANATADIHLHPSGTFLYASNRGHNSIIAFLVDEKSGKLKLIDYFSTEGKTPRNFGISSDGKFLYAANQDSDSITGFRIDENTGKLYKIQKAKVMSPVCIEFTQ